MQHKPSKYQVIVEELKQKMASGEWPPNHMIPSQTELAALYQTSEITSRRALSELVNQGLIYRIRGKGSFVKGDTQSAEGQPDSGSPNPNPNPNPKPLERIYLVHNAGESIIALNHTFYMEMCAGIQAEANRLGIEFRLWDYAIYKRLPQKERTGYILNFMGNDAFEMEEIEKWFHGGCNMVTVHSYVPQLPIPYVISDNLTGGYLATQHLLSLGHKRIGILLTGSSVIELNQEFSLRLQGYRLALGMHKVPFDQELVHIVEGSNENQQLGYQGFEYFRGLSDPPTAIFATSDLKAYGVLRAALRSGLFVPDDLSIVGYDNMHFGQLTMPNLTTINQNSYKLGKKAVEILASGRTEPGHNGSLKDEIVPELIVRETTAAYTQ